MTPGQKLALLFSALSLGAGGVVASEGWVLKGYPDPVKGKALPTACSGVTEGVLLGKVYSEQECLQMQALAMVKTAGPILACVRDDFPAAGAPYLRTMANTSVNIGPAAFQGSSMCRKMLAGDYRGACDALLLWNKAGGRDCTIRANNCYGVIVRRQEQRADCLKALP